MLKESLAPLALAALLLGSCASLSSSKPSVELIAGSGAVEVGQVVSLSLRLSMPGGPPRIAWSASSGTIVPTAVDNEVDFRAPSEPGEATIVARATSGGRTLAAEAKLRVLPAGGLKKTAEVIVEVDCNSLRKVWVDESHPAEDFSPPLKIKGTFSLDTDTGEAQSGGSWQLYAMRDDGRLGDRAAGDGIWTMRFVLPKSGAKVYFAFDDSGEYRKGFESGLAWRLKLAWRGVDEAGSGEVSDSNNLFFVPDRDQVVAWTAEMASRSSLYAEAAK
jgi:hypothetical protein